LHIHFLIQFYKGHTQGVGVYRAASLSKTPKTPKTAI
jgi:hypothetical protein